MEKFLVKVKHTLPTYLYVTVGTVVIVSILRWLAFEFNLFELKEMIWVLWMPMILPLLPITIWLRPKLRILIRKKESDKMQFGFQMIAWFATTASLMASQAYLNTAMGDLATINVVSDMHIDPKVKYFIIKDFTVLRKFGASAEDIRTSGKSNQYLDIKLYFVAPIVKDSSDNLPLYNCWYGVKFHKQISNRISTDEKEEKYKAFYQECIDKMNHYNFHELQYFLRVPKSDDRDVFLKAVARVDLINPIAKTGKFSSISQPVILEPKKDPFEDRNGNKLFWVFGSLGIGLVVFLFCLIWPRYSFVELERQHKGVKPKSDDVIDMLKYLIPKAPHFGTSVILDINILVCLIMVLSGLHPISPNGLELMEWGASRRFETTHGEAWRLFSSMFVHAGVVHLLFNIYGLVIAGSFLEALIGAKKYMFIYLASGLVASVASILWHDHASVGASGAIFGLFGAILSFLVTDLYVKNGKRQILLIFGPYVVINLLMGFAGVGIDNAAHIGGLVCGFVMGLLLYVFGDKEELAESN